MTSECLVHVLKHFCTSPPFVQKALSKFTRVFFTVIEAVTNFIHYLLKKHLKAPLTINVPKEYRDKRAKHFYIRTKFLTLTNTGEKQFDYSNSQVTY